MNKKNIYIKGLSIIVICMLLGLFSRTFILPAGTVRTSDEKIMISVIENAAKKAAERGQYGWYDTSYGRIYILQDGTLVKGPALIADTVDGQVLENGAYKKKDVKRCYFFDERTGIMKTESYAGVYYYGNDGRLTLFNPRFLILFIFYSFIYAPVVKIIDNKYCLIPSYVDTTVFIVSTLCWGGAAIYLLMYGGAFLYALLYRIIVL